MVETVIIYDQVDAALSFLIVQGDVSHLNGTYINSSEADDEKVQELDKLVHEYGPDGEFVRSTPKLSEFPVEAVKRGARVIICGFLP